MVTFFFVSTAQKGKYVLSRKNIFSWLLCKASCQQQHIGATEYKRGDVVMHAPCLAHAWPRGDVLWALLIFDRDLYHV